MTRPPRRRIRPEDIATVIKFAMAQLPEEIQRALDDVEILVVDGHDAPELRHLRDADGQPLAPFAGFYVGSVIEGDDAEELPEAPVGVIYLNAAALRDQDEIEKTLLHEIGHALGLSEDEVAALGLD